MALLCTPCEKGNHSNCLYDVVDVTAHDHHVVTCECRQCADECESCGKPDDGEDERFGTCEHGKLLCGDCSNECRLCEDEAAQDEAVDRQLAEARGN
jgi:hypothetical protein